MLSVKGLSRQGEFHPLDLEVRPGEIVGLAGLVGSGRSEILETVYGARRASTGQVFVEGRPLRPGSVRAAVRAGLGLAPEERKAQALLMLESVTATCRSPPCPASRGRLARPRRRTGGGARGDPRAVPAPRQPLRARAHPVRRQPAEGGPRPLAAARLQGPAPRRTTRGVDVGARAELYAVIRRLADEGLAVLLVSSEVPEVLGLADRVLVLREGRVVHEAPPANSTNTAYSTS